VTSNHLYHGHAVEKLKTIKDNTVDSCICSPPYKGLRNYHTVDQLWKDNWTGSLGREPTSEMFVGHLMEVFDQVKRVLKDIGTCFVVIGDSYNNSSTNRNGLSTGNVSRRVSDYDAGIKKERERDIPLKSLLMVPEQFAIAMIEHGWCLRNKIIWVKGNPMPSPVRDRFSNSWEYVYFFTKSNESNYWVNEKTLSVSGVKPLGTSGSETIDWDWKPNGEGVLKKSSNWLSYDYFFKTLYQPYAESTLKEFTEIYTGQNKKDYKGNDVQPASDVKRNIIAKKHPLFGGNKGAGGDNATYSGKEWIMSLLGSKKRDVFNINTQPFPQAHFAVFPEKLVTPLIECGSPRYLCSACGLPQVEVYDEFRVDTRPGIETGTGKSGTDLDPNQNLHNSELSKKRQMIIHKPEAKIAKCKCNKPFKQSVILDPFFGAGTVGVVAQKLHRAWIGIELQQEYVEIAKNRLAQT